MDCFVWPVPWSLYILYSGGSETLYLLINPDPLGTVICTFLLLEFSRLEFLCMFPQTNFYFSEYALRR